ncbi:hypothetical protein VDG1235_3106 [Verrucomicrobiia bacterium DG1235]|nr:hypothetical protein VDG1235_3106 [Verrucomicrobiae bacterium DG1235]
MLPRILIAIVLATATLQAAPTQSDILYVADSTNPAHRLDLYLPANNQTPAPLIVWTHGGAWRGGTKDSVGIEAMTERGWAIASVEYRLSTEAPFPALIHDIKAAIRYLRANAAELHLDPNTFVIAGDSAGGHLAALVGLSSHDPYLEGTLGAHLDTSSDIQAVVALFGAHNLTTILSQSTPHGLNVRAPALELLLGGPIADTKEAAVLASPIHYVSEHSCPVFIMHGDQDPQMPVNQSLELWGKCKELGIPTHLEIIRGGAHGGPRFYDATRLDIINTFLHSHLATH